MTPQPILNEDEPPDPAIPEGGYHIRALLSAECYCGHVCREHTELTAAQVCMAAHRLFCPWAPSHDGDHARLLDELVQAATHHPF